MAPGSLDPQWWRAGVLYQIYPRSWADSDGDGIGDITGIIGRLDYLSWLGVSGVWLNPITDSPNEDWGYDVCDYTSVHPDLGTLGDLDELVARAAERGIAIILDLVPNHTSDRHPWFVEARTRRNAPTRNRYVWRDPKPGGGAPNNWLSAFGGRAWTLDDRTGQFYLHNFLPEMPDLNWWDDDVHNAFDEILRFWFDRGIAGFRIDVAHGIVKDRDLRDNPPVEDGDHPEVRRLGQRPEHNFNRPEVHDVLKRWRRITGEYVPERVLIGETYVLEVERWAAFYGAGDDELHLAFNFPFAFSPFEAGALRAAVELAEAAIPPGAWPVWMGSNHDIGRFPTRWCGGDDRAARCALMMLLTLRGTPLLYYGDEIGMQAVAVPAQRTRDPVARLSGGSGGRDPFRTPMRWSPGPGAGFTDRGAEPWLPAGDGPCVSTQKRDPGSMLHLCRDLIGLRKDTLDLRSGPYETIPAPEGVWAWRRGRALAIALNLGDGDAAVSPVSGRIAVGTDRSRDREPVSGTLELGSLEGAVVVAS